MTDEIIDQTIILQTYNGYETRIEIEQNKILSDIFQHGFIGQNDEDTWETHLMEEQFRELYKYLSTIIGYNAIPNNEEKEALLELYQAMYDIICQGLLEDVELFYHCKYLEEEEE